MLGSVIAVLISAFVTGGLARFAVPGPDPMPAWLTVAIGLAGSLIGWGIVAAAIGPDPAWTGIVGFLAAVALVIAYRRLVQKRAVWGPEAYRFPQRGFGVDAYRERLTRAGIDPDRIGAPFATRPVQAPIGSPFPARADGAGDPTENPSHYLGLLADLYDAGVLTDEEYDAARTRLLERLRA
jgi:uncharacterized membrane protein YeaQ/YmgE (transglycosylase-associated protein family)